MADAHHDRYHHESESNAPRKRTTGFGITECTCCGVSVDVVGQLGAIPEWPKHCEFCGRKMQASVRLEEEAKRLVRPWIEARMADGICGPQLIDEVAEAARLVVEEWKAGVPGPQA